MPPNACLHVPFVKSAPLSCVSSLVRPIDDSQAEATNSVSANELTSVHAAIVASLPISRLVPFLQGLTTKFVPLAT